MELGSGEVLRDVLWMELRAHRKKQLSGLEKALGHRHGDLIHSPAPRERVMNGGVAQPTERSTLCSPGCKRPLWTRDHLSNPSCIYSVYRTLIWCQSEAQVRRLAETST